MAIFTRRQLTTAEQEDLFVTVDNNKNTLPTKGYYIIARRTILEQQATTEAKNDAGLEPRPEPIPVKVVVIATVDYSNGVAPYNPLYQKGDMLYIYPEGYFGVQSKVIGANIVLSPTDLTQTLIIEKLTEFVNSKLPQRS